MEPRQLFPEFQRFARETNLLSKVSGSLSAKLPRILGQGQTKATGMDLPPADIERQMELVGLELPADILLPEAVTDEIRKVKEGLDGQLRQVSSEEGARRLCSQVIARIAPPNGIKNNYFYAGRFLLVPDKKRLSWSWSITPHYPIISRIPPDVDYIVRAHEIADKKINELLMEPKEFELKLTLAWHMARHFSRTEDVRIVDVARMFLIAAQDNVFWQSPQKKNFKDIPPASFVSNYLNWKNNQTGEAEVKFELVPAVLKQAFGPDAKVFFLPLDYEGTQTRPYIYMRARM